MATHQILTSNCVCVVSAQAKSAALLPWHSPNAFACGAIKKQGDTLFGMGTDAQGRSLQHVICERIVDVCFLLCGVLVVQNRTIKARSRQLHTRVSSVSVHCSIQELEEGLGLSNT